MRKSLFTEAQISRTCGRKHPARTIFALLFGEVNTSADKLMV